MVEFLIVHVLSPIEETARRDLGKDLGAGEQLDDLLLQLRQDVVLGQAHEFFELPKALAGGALGVGQREFVLVQKLEHLLKCDGVVRHQGEYILLRDSFVCFGFFDLFCELGRALEGGLVSVELRTVWAELDDKDRSCEVPVVLV